MTKSYVGFIFGGESAESDVSVVTALGLEKQIRGVTEFVPVFLYVSKSREFFLVPSSMMNVETFKNPEKYLRKNRIEIKFGGLVVRSSRCSHRRLCSLDAVVNCMHGGDGENGAIAGYMKTLGVPFSTSSHLALGLSMNKNLFKRVLRASGILVPSWVYFSKKEWLKNSDDLLEKIQALRFPVVVKPNSSGSSLGVTVAKSLTEIKDAVNVAMKFDDEIIIEKFVQNKVEFNCAVLGS